MVEKHIQSLHSLYFPSALGERVLSMKGKKKITWNHWIKQSTQTFIQPVGVKDRSCSFWTKTLKQPFVSSVIAVYFKKHC